MLCNQDPQLSDLRAYEFDFVLIPASACMCGTIDWLQMHAYHFLACQESYGASIGDKMGDLIPRLSRIIVCLIPFLLSGCAVFNITKAPNAEDFTRQARVYLDEGLTDSALASFGMAIEMDPAFVPAHVGMGSVYQVYGNFELALRCFERAIDLDPNAYEPRYRYGWVKHITGDLDRAIESYLRALAISPDSFDANLKVGGGYLQMGRPGDALSYAKRATELNPDDQGAWANLGATYGLLGRYEDAIDAYRQAVELGEMIEPILLGLANAQIELGRYPQAINVLNSLIDRIPSAVAYRRRGYVQFKMREYEQAAVSFQEALTWGGEEVVALNGVGVSFMAMYLQASRDEISHRERALHAWRRSLQLHANQPHIVDLISRYQKL